jgi:integrase
MDPLVAKREAHGSLRAAAAQAMTFRQCAEGFLKDNDSQWSCAKHRLEWERSLRKYAFPILGSLPVASIDTPLVLQVIKPLWARVPETASRVRGRIENVLGWATVHHYRTGDNPARWNGLLEHALPGVVKGEHHKALPYVEMPAFMAKLREQTSVTAKCIEFIALTAARLAEAQAATWDEIDLDGKVWIVPAGRMKAGVEIVSRLVRLCSLSSLVCARFGSPTTYSLGLNQGGPLAIICRSSCWERWASTQRFTASAAPSAIGRLRRRTIRTT